MAARALSILSTSTFHSPCLPKKPTTISSSSSRSQNSFVSCLSPLSGSLFGESIYQSLRPLIPSPKQGLFHSAMVLSMLPTAKHDIAPDKIPNRWSARSIKSFGMGELEARKLKYPNTGTEALLMGILVEGTSRAARFLRENGITLFKVREETVKLLGKSDMYFFSPEHPPLTEPAQRALDWAVDEKTKSEMRMLGWMSGFTLRDRIRNEHIREKVEVAPVEDKIRESCLRWFDHIKQWPSNDPVRKVEVRVVRSPQPICF